MIMPLTKIREGNKAVLQAVEGGRQLRSRLAALGLLPGTELEVIQNSGHGPFVVSVKGSRIVIGRGMAEGITVE
jgi:Fe2+ transport system protein FeoA